ncbi:heparinase II/III-family protein, partial [Endozoicomonas sp. ONNA1]
FRDKWDKKPWVECSYLAYSASFHKRTHKHADDFTFEWSELGQRILVDAGKFGYEKNSVERLYVESTRAHNCVEIDEKDYSRYNHDIFGSAIEAWSEAGDVKLVDSFLFRKRFFDTRHRRIVLFKPGKWLLIIDHLKSPTKHKFTQWFHFDPNLHLNQTIDSIHADLSPENRVWVTNFGDNEKSEHLKAQFEPRLQGWISVEPYKLEPNDAIGFTVDNSEEHTFATLFSISKKEGNNPQPIMLKSNSAGKYIRVKWKTPEGNAEDIIYRNTNESTTLLINDHEVPVTTRYKNH